VIKNQIRPFAREILPVVNQLGPSTQQLAESFPKLSVSFSVLNEFFNELAFNPGQNKGGFLFFLPWANHNLNSVVSSADAHGPLGRSLLYFNCEILPLFTGVSEINPTVNLLVGLLKPPTKAECQAQGILKTGAAVSASARPRSAPSRGLFSGLGSPFGHAAAKRAPTSPRRAHAATSGHAGGGR
jgi:hypothetical protein